MDELVLNDGGDNKHYLSIISPQDMSPKEGCENINLFFYEEKDDVYGKICGGLLYLDNFDGKIVLCNLTTKEFKFLPPPEKSSPCVDVFNVSGLGYDSKSGDYKVIRNYDRWYCRGGVDEDGIQSFYDHCDTKTELYSLKRDSWKEIPNPVADVSPDCGVYIGGSCYWEATLGADVQSYHDLTFDILSFNFTGESFSCLPSLPLRLSDYFIDLVECRGYLGAIAYERPKESGVCKSFQLWVCKERSWAKTFSVALRGIEKPLGLKDGRFLFLERKRRSSSKRRSSDELLVYDCITKEWKKPDIFSRAQDVNIYSRAQDVKVLSFIEDRVLLVYDWITGEQVMKVLSYVENRALLPDAKPINGPPNVEDSSEKVFRRCCRSTSSH